MIALKSVYGILVKDEIEAVEVEKRMKELEKEYLKALGLLVEEEQEEEAQAHEEKGESGKEEKVTEPVEEKEGNVTTEAEDKRVRRGRPPRK